MTRGPFGASRPLTRARASVLLALALIMLGVSGVPDAGEIVVSDILASPNRFAGERVVLTGKVTNLKSTSRKGVPYHVFDLSDGLRTITVLAPGPPTCDNGALATVEGWVQVSGRGSQIVPRLEATRVSCP